MSKSTEYKSMLKKAINRELSISDLLNVLPDHNWVTDMARDIVTIQEREGQYLNEATLDLVLNDIYNKYIDYFNEL